MLNKVSIGSEKKIQSCFIRPQNGQRQNKCLYFTVPARPLRRFRVALDIEGCIDRFYGGYYSGKLILLFPYVCLCLIRIEFVCTKKSY